MITIEDTIEILAGTQPRKINIRLEMADLKLITSLGKQLSKNIALTDRQLMVSLKKIEKYQENLRKCGVDVDQVLNLKPLKWPLREIDRTQEIKIDYEKDTKKPFIVVRYVFSKKFAEVWAKIEQNLGFFGHNDKGIKKVLYSELNLYHIVKDLSPMDFKSSPEVREIYEKIEKILENPENFVPYLDFVDESILLKNVNIRCETELLKKFQKVDDSNLLEYIDYAKSLGVTLKSQNLLKKIEKLEVDTLTKNASLEKSTRYRVYPENYSVNDLATTINNLNQWPLVVVIEENQHIFATVKSMVDAFSQFVPKDKMNVFFRLKNEQTDQQQFNQFVKDNGLNNYINSETKIVFISRTRIPKPLIKADWKPTTAIVVSSHDFGRMAAYLNDFSNVYYYNSSIAMRNSRLKGADKIAQL